MDNPIIKDLCRLPVKDINFTYALKMATRDDIRCAIMEMQEDTNGKHKTRISACERELRKRMNRLLRKMK